MNPANPLDPLIRQFASLPSIGRKSAARIVFHLLNQSADLSQSLGQRLIELHEQIRHCQRCGNYTSSGEICSICSDSSRSCQRLCIVEHIQDLYTIEGAQSYDGYYHVLHGVLSPLNGVGPEQLQINKLLQRIEDEGFTEVILATNPTLEGDATAIYIKQLLADKGDILVSRIASGLPVGGDLEYADRLSIMRALESRFSF